MSAVGAMNKWADFGRAWNLHRAMRYAPGAVLLSARLFDLLIEHGFEKPDGVEMPVLFFDGPVVNEVTVWSNLLGEAEREVRRVFLGPSVLMGDRSPMTAPCSRCGWASVCCWDREGNEIDNRTDACCPVCGRP